MPAQGANAAVALDYFGASYDLETQDATLAPINSAEWTTQKKNKLS